MSVCQDINVEKAEFVEVSSLPGSDRGSGGFGSTGKSS